MKVLLMLECVIFFNREHKIESLHPMVRGDYDEGYAITANKIRVLIILMIVK